MYKVLSAGAVGALLMVTVAPARAATVEVVQNGADFRVFVPDGPVRGIITAFNGSGADFRAQADNATAQAVATSWSFAFVATRGFGGSNGSGMFAQLNGAMAQVASMTAHPELVNAPFFLTGYSLGGHASTSIVAAAPERILGFVAMRGGILSGALAASAAGVPGLFIVASGDDITDLAWSAFTAFRGQGAAVGFVVEWLARHVPAPADDGPTWGFTWLYASEVIRLRYPADRKPTATLRPTLDPIKQEDGWLTLHPTWTGSSLLRTSAFPEVVPFADWKGDKSDASWLPSQAVANYYQAFVARQKLGNVVPRNVEMAFASPATTSGLALTVGAAGKMDVTVDPRTLIGIQRLDIHAGARWVASLAAAPWSFSLVDVPAGIHGLTALATVADGPRLSYATYLMPGAALFDGGEGRNPAGAPQAGQGGMSGQGGSSGQGGGAGAGGAPPVGGMNGGGEGGTPPVGGEGGGAGGEGGQVGAGGSGGQATGGTAGNDTSGSGSGCTLAHRRPPAGLAWLVVMAALWSRWCLRSDRQS